MTDLEMLRYPIGRFTVKPEATQEDFGRWIDDIESLPARLRALVAPLSDDQLDTPYRPEGWTVRKLVHHVADSHVNAYVRFKLAVTEENPTIKTYDQDLWAALGDVDAPVGVSLDLLEALHYRWARFLRSLGKADLSRPFYHPESGPMKVSDLLQLYSWHSRHHTAHISELVSREGW